MIEITYAMYLLWIALGGCSAGILLKLIFSRKTNLATAKLGKQKDIQDLLGADGFQISKNIILSEKQCNGHIAIFAPTRTGKTTSLFIPNLLQNNLRGSIIVSDPKSELYRLTHIYQEKICKRKVIRYQPLNIKGKHRNPLAACRSEKEVKQLSQALLMSGSIGFEVESGKKAGGLEWLQMTISLLSAALLYYYPTGTIKQAIFLVLSHSFDELTEVFSKAKDSARIQYMMFKTSENAPSLISSIKNTFASNLQLFTEDLAINRLDFNLDNIRNEETIIYINYPEEDALYLSPLTSCLFSQIISHAIQDYKEGCLPTWILADEFCNVGQWNSFSSKISTAGSRHINFVLCMQSSTQLKQVYGENYISILNNCNTVIALPGLKDTSTLQWIMSLCGNEQINIKKAKDVINTTKKLSDESETRRIETGHELILITNRQPIIDEQNIYFIQEKYMENIL